MQIAVLRKCPQLDLRQSVRIARKLGDDQQTFGSQCLRDGLHVAEGSLMFLPVRVMVNEEDLADAVALQASAA